MNRLKLIFSILAMAIINIQTSASAQDSNALLMSTAIPANAIWLESLDTSQMLQGYGSPNAAKSVDGHALTLNGVVYPHGLGTHARSEFLISLKRSALKFVAMAGVDDETAGKGSVIFQVYLDGKLKADTGILKGSDKPKEISVDLRGAKTLKLVVEDAGDGNGYDHADWAGAAILLDAKSKSKPAAFSLPSEPMPKLAFGDSPRPAIHGARVVGATPGRPFLFLIPATGQAPLTFSAKNLPAGLTLDSNTGIISGTLQTPGETVSVITVSGPLGVSSRKLRIVGGEHKLALTPPLGWNSWNVWANAVDDGKVRAAADSMIKSGLAAHGFNYVNIDDCWEAGRNAAGEIQSNSKFPDMKALADYVHSKGLHIGIYSSPGPKTCGGFEASYQHELLDAQSYARWGFDYLKYDWCSYEDVADGLGLEQLQKPYRVMREALDKVDRDILFSFCQYGMGDVWQWGAQIGGNCWRTTGDINDSWGSLNDIAFSQNGHEKFAGPGHWNDPDMLVVGKLGWGPNIHPSHLTPNEQITHISMWCLLSSPLLIGCDMTQLDRFTLSLLTNDEALDVNQDPLGKPAGRKLQDGTSEVWSRQLWDGTTAVGLVNRGAEAAEITASWALLGIDGEQPVRDIWRRKTLGFYDTRFTVKVPPHGTMFVKIGEPRRD